MMCFFTNTHMLILFLSTLIILSDCSRSTFKSQPYDIIQGFQLTEGPIYAKGWLKYTTFTQEEKTKPREFFKNLAFFEQMKSGISLDLTEKDIIGYKNIPDEDHFFFILTDTSLNVLSARKEHLAKTVEILNISEIANKTSHYEFQGGVMNHGDFLEGFCFQIKTFSLQKKKVVIWEVCADSQKEKSLWMNTLYKFLDLKKKKSPELQQAEKRMQKLITEGLGDKETKAKKNKAKDATWVAIAPWTECSRSCGGGKSYLQRICILPANSTKVCEGERILTRDCNLQPCDPNQSNATHLLPTKSSESYETMFIPVSRKPTRYERCFIKEGDLAIYIDSGHMLGAKIPTRVILNNQTLTAYSSDEYTSIIVAHRLTTLTAVQLYTKEPSKTCFAVEESKKKKTIFCTFVSAGKTLTELAQEWIHDILDFTKNCGNYYSHELEYDDMKDLNPEAIKNALDFYREHENHEMETIIGKTQHLALQAMEKELQIENMIEKEEEERQKKIEDNYQKELDKLKSQSELINSQISEKKKQAQIYQNKKMLKRKIQQITEKVKQEVIQNRNDLKVRLLQKQKDMERKMKLFQSRMNEMKQSISEGLLKASKNGNSDKCDPELSSQEIIQYCKVNYSTDYAKMNECVKQENFCYMCCESEYGEMHLEQRTNCYSRCDDFYIFQKKFKPDTKLRLEISVTPYGVKTNEIIEEKKETLPSINSPDHLPSRFLETQVQYKALPSQLQGSVVVTPADESSKKEELLLKIKEELSSL